MSGAPHFWQADAWTHLMGLRRRERLPHALLLHGQAGLGLDDFARRFANALVCTVPGPDGAPCGACPACRQFAEGVYPDYHEVTPEADRQGIGVDQIRALIDFLALTRSHGRPRPVLISPAEAMNANAANSLLKTLEEPPADAHLLLVCTRLDRLPATILSRCQRIHFSRPPHATAVDWLAGQGHPPPQAEQLLALAHGAPCAAARLAEEAVLERHAAFVTEVLRVLAGQGSAGTLRAASAELDTATLLDWSESLLRDLLRLRAGVDGPFETPIATGRLRKLAASLDWRDLFDFQDRLLASRATLEHPLNADLQRDVILLGWEALTCQHRKSRRPPGRATPAP